MYKSSGILNLKYLVYFSVIFLKSAGFCVSKYKLELSLYYEKSMKQDRLNSAQFLKG